MGRGKRKREEQARRNRLLIFIAVVVVVIVIIVYFVSLGKINLIPEEDERTKRIRWIDNRLKDLHFQAASKAELKKELDEKVKHYFKNTRIALAVIYLALNTCAFIWWTDCSTSINDRISALLNYNQIALIVILVALFIRFETPSEFRDVFKLIHLYVIRIVYKNHAELDEEIKAIHIEIEVLTKEKDGLSNPEPPATDSSNNHPQLGS